jgi:predicted acyl esterase
VARRGEAGASNRLRAGSLVLVVVVVVVVVSSYVVVFMLRQECVQWLDHHLRGSKTTAMSMPKLRVYLRSVVPPSAKIDNWPGSWISLSCWPASPSADAASAQSFSLSGTSLIPSRRGSDDGTALTAAPRRIVGRMFAGQFSGAWLSFGGPDLAPNQTVEDGMWLCWDTEPLSMPVIAVGSASVTVTISVSQSVALLSARLCAVDPRCVDVDTVTLLPVVVDADTGVWTLAHSD